MRNVTVAATQMACSPDTDANIERAVAMVREAAARGADIILIDGAAPGSGEVFDWSLAEDAPKAGHRVMLAGGLDHANVAEAINLVRPWGVDVSTGVESEPGKKDPVMLRAFIEAAKGVAIEAVTPAGAPGGHSTGPYDWQDEL